MTVLRDCSATIFITKLKSLWQIPGGDEDDDDGGCWYSLSSISSQSTYLKSESACLLCECVHKITRGNLEMWVSILFI